MTKIVIVAGGLATRMGSVTEEIPKCLININGKPLIEHQINFFKKNNYNDIVFCIAHLANKVKEYFKDGERFGVKIKYVEEEKELLGTAGSVKLAEDLIEDEDFIVYYGDNITSMDFDKFIEFHKQKNGMASVFVRPLSIGRKSSSMIKLDENNKITRFIEKPSAEEIEKNKNEKIYINNGIYALKKEILSLIPKNVKFDFGKDLFPMIIEKNYDVYGYLTDDFYREIGTFEKYQRSLEEFKGKKNILE